MVAPPLPPPSGFPNPFLRRPLNLSQSQQRRVPSIHFCDTGELDEGEAYNPEIHNVGTTPQERCSRFYQQYRGGKKKRKTRRNKKIRKNRRKTRHI